MISIEENFSKDIEAAVQSILTASHRAAIAALDEAFKVKAPRSTRARPPTERTVGYSRRTAQELSALSERLYQTISDAPGETMAVIARHVGEPPDSLQVPVARLKRMGRIRTVGERQFTRYFPMVDNDASEN